MLETNFTIDFGSSRFNAVYVRTVETAIEVLAKLQEQDGLMGVDIETEPLPDFRLDKLAGLSPWLAKIRLIQVFTGKTAIIFDVKHIGVTDIFIPFLEGKKFVAHNAIFELQFFKRIGVKQMDIGCTMLAVKLLFHTLYETDAGLGAGLAEVCTKILKVPMRKELQVSDWTVSNLTFEQIEYAGRDAIATLLLAKKFVKALNTYSLSQIYTLYKKSLHTIGEIQLNGMTLDVVNHVKMVNVWKNELYEAKKQVLEMTGLPRITSSTLAEYLQKILPPDILSIWPRTETGKLSTNAHAFADFNYLDIVKPFSEYQKKDKLTSSFGAPLQDFINPVTHNIHAQYHLCGTRSGRLSCSKCNIQQSPKDPSFRKLFVAEPGTSYICADYSAIEVRAAAEISKDKNMIKAFRSGADIYRATAAMMNKKKIEDVTPLERQSAKPLILGLNFGLGAKKLGHYAKKNYGVELTESQSYKQVDAYRTLYSGFREWQLKQVQDVADNKFVVDAIFGKKRKLDPTNAFGTALNHPIQSACASMMLLAMLKLRQIAPSYVKLIASVHDEIIIQTPNEHVEEGKYLINFAMREAYQDTFVEALVLTDNLVSIGVGPSWGEAKA